MISNQLYERCDCFWTFSLFYIAYLRSVISINISIYTYINEKRRRLLGNRIFVLLVNLKSSTLKNDRIYKYTYKFCCINACVTLAWQPFGKIGSTRSMRSTHTWIFFFFFFLMEKECRRKRRYGVVMATPSWNSSGGISGE